jgi:hypothetical protein
MLNFFKNNLLNRTSVPKKRKDEEEEEKWYEKYYDKHLLENNYHRIGSGTGNCLEDPRVIKIEYNPKEVLTTIEMSMDELNTKQMFFVGFCSSTIWKRFCEMESDIDIKVYYKHMGYETEYIICFEATSCVIGEEESKEDIEFPSEFLCPILRTPFVDPVVMDDGFSYERSAISEWISGGGTISPMTGLEFKSNVMHSNQILKGIMMELLSMNE